MSDPSGRGAALSGAAAGQGRHRRLPALPVALAAVLALAACDVADPYLAPRFDFRPAYAGAPARMPVLLADSAWWRGLGDPGLDRLVALALAGNPTLDQARARIEAAEAARAAVPGAGLITAEAAALAREPGAPDRLGRGELGLSWLFDPWGARRRELEIAGAEADIARAGLDAARLALLLGLGRDYAELRYRQRLLALSQGEMEGRRRTLALVRRLVEAGEATRLETTRSEARIAEIAARLPGEAAAVAAVTNQLAVLAGRVPGGLPPDLAAALAAAAPQPRPGLDPEVGIPADLIRNRPDIAIAERGYYAALARIGAAEAALYPRLSLTGTLSADTAGGGAAFVFGPRLDLPALPGGAGQARLAQRRAEAAAALAAWRVAVTGAVLEVENALLDYRAVAASTGAAARAARLHRDALAQTRAVFDSGEATLTDLIAAEEAVAAADRALAGLLWQQAASFVALNIRLGAGHGAPPPG